jgi:hypothetical protein
VAIEAVGAVADGDARGRVGPADLSTGAAVAEGRLRVGVAEAPVGTILVARDHQAQPAIRSLPEDDVGEVRVPNLAGHRDGVRLPDRRAVRGLPSREESLVEERQGVGVGEGAASRDPRAPHLGLVEALDRLFRDLGNRRLGEAQLLEVRVREFLAAVFDVRGAGVLFVREPHEQIGQAERLGDPLPNEVVVGEPGTPLDDLGDHVHARRGVIDEAAARLEVQPPALEVREPLVAIQEDRGVEGGGGEAGGVREELLDADGVLPVASELGDDGGHLLVDG